MRPSNLPPTRAFICTRFCVWALAPGSYACGPVQEGYTGWCSYLLPAGGKLPLHMQCARLGNRVRYPEIPACTWCSVLPELLTWRPRWVLVAGHRRLMRPWDASDLPQMVRSVPCPACHLRPLSLGPDRTAHEAKGKSNAKPVTRGTSCLWFFVSPVFLPQVVEAAEEGAGEGVQHAQPARPACTPLQVSRGTNQLARWPPHEVESSPACSKGALRIMPC